MVFRYDDYPYIISFDFGTTYSGTSYSVDKRERTKAVPKPEEIPKSPVVLHITKWPINPIDKKMPSIVIYNNTSERKLLYWGGQAFDKLVSAPEERYKNNMIVVEKFKLRLPIFLAQKGAIHQSGRSGEGSEEKTLDQRATEDYFTKIYEHTLEQIKSEEKDNFDKDKARFIMTVPASWNEVQRATMRKVALVSGLVSELDHENRLLIINESLAATLYCEREDVDPKNQGKNKDMTLYRGSGCKFEPLKPGDRYIVCDAGGGTVDLATLECTKGGADGYNDSFRRCQLTADSGDFCGSTYLDENYKNLLLFILFGIEKKDKSLERTEEEQKKIALIADYISDFIKNTKPAFGTKKSENFNCGHDEVDGSSCFRCKNDEEFIDHDNFGDATRLFLNKGNISKQLNYAEIKARLEANQSTLCGVTFTNRDEIPSDVESDCEEFDFGSDDESAEEEGAENDEENVKYVENEECILCEDESELEEEDTSGFDLVIPYKVMKALVFDEVVETTLKLLRQQINKSNGNIKRTYLVGGFGSSVYLCKKILKCFQIPGSNPKRYEIGELMCAEKTGDLAAMKGGVYYGVDGNKRESQKEIVCNDTLKDTVDKYETLVCIDIGYNGTACFYKSLKDNSEDMTVIKTWPGLANGEERIIIPTAKVELGDGKAIWGAEVKEITNVEPRKLTMFSKLMSTVKKDFRLYMTKYLQLIIKHIHDNVIKTDKKTWRYVITMESCYKFFHNSSEMRRIARDAGLIDQSDPNGRLLLIQRESAAAMYYEKQYFVNEKYSNAFLQINLYHNICHMTLHEAIKINDIGQNDHFRNVRTVRRATFNFNFINRLVDNLDSFVSTNVCITCSASKVHDTYNPEYYTGIRAGFLKYIKEKLNFANSDRVQEIEIITESGCCQIEITIYDLLEYVFRPTIRDLASEMNRFATEVDMALFYVFDKIIISGVLLDTTKEAHELLERILAKYLSEAANIGSAIIGFSNDNGQEALIGAAHFGNNPFDFTERVARKSYVVKITAYYLKEKDKAVKEKLKELEKKSKHERYNYEASKSLIDESKKLTDIRHESPYKPSLETDDLKRGGEFDVTYLIRRGDKITEHNQTDGIIRKFYVKDEDCIVYATIYSSEEDDVPEKDAYDFTDHISKFQKIHRFEIFVKKDPDDPMTRKAGSRIPFEVCYIPDNNEAKFEANLCSRLGEKNPEFRFRDEFLVANIFDDKSSIPVGDLKIHNDASPLVDSLSVTEPSSS